MPQLPFRFSSASDLLLARNGNQVRPPPTPIAICRVLRPLSGGSQSQLVQGDDNNFYVAKFMGNPQGNRTLINEVIAHRLVMHLGLSTSKICLLNLSESVKNSEEIFFHIGDRRVSPQSGLHLGSMCPVDPENTAIFDFLPTPLLSKIINLKEFASMFVLDRWLHNTDKRQAIFVRDRSLKSGANYRAYFIDNGMIFSGSDWQLGDVPLHGLAFPRSIYSMINMRLLSAAAVYGVQSILPATLDAAAENLPTAWFGSGDCDSLKILLDGVKKRQASLLSLVVRHLNALNL